MHLFIRASKWQTDMCKMCVLTFKNFNFPTVYHAFFNLWCLRFRTINIFENVDMSWLIIDIFTGFEVPPELCDWWWHASGRSAPSEKTRPGVFEHVSCEFGLFWWILGPPDLFVQKVDNLFKWLCQQDAHRNSGHTDVLCCRGCSVKVRFLRSFLKI